MLMVFLLLRSEHAHCSVTYGKIAVSLFVTRAGFFSVRVSKCTKLVFNHNMLKYTRTPIQVHPNVTLDLSLISA